MTEHRRRFSPQFKAEAVQMVIETGKPIAGVARDLGINDGTLGNWVTRGSGSTRSLLQSVLITMADRYRCAISWRAASSLRSAGRRICGSLTRQGPQRSRPGR